MSKNKSAIEAAFRLFLLWAFVVAAFHFGGMVGGAIAAAFAMFLFWGLFLYFQRSNGND